MAAQGHMPVRTTSKRKAHQRIDLHYVVGADCYFAQVVSVGLRGDEEVLHTTSDRDCPSVVRGMAALWLAQHMIGA